MEVKVLRTFGEVRVKSVDEEGYREVCWCCVYLTMK